MERTINIAIIDDEISSLEIISDIAKNTFLNKNINTSVDLFQSSEKLFSMLKNKHYELIFMDIELKNEDGIVLAEEISKMNLDSKVIFVSSHEDRVFDSLKTHPYGFIRKGSFVKDFTFVIESFLKGEDNDSDEKKLILKGKSTTAISISNIIYIESQGKYQFIYTSSPKEKIMVRQNMNDFQEELSPFGFIRIHKGYLVNSSYIRTINDEDVTLIDDTNLILSKRKVKAIREEYLLILKNKKQAIVLNSK